MLPPSPTVPQLVVEFPPSEVTRVLARIPSEFQIVIAPPLPPGVVPCPPFDVTVPAVDVAIDIVPPLPPAPLLFTAPFEIRAFTLEFCTVMFQFFHLL